MEGMKVVIQVVLAILALVALYGVYMVLWGASAAGYGSADASWAIFAATVAVMVFDKSCCCGMMKKK
jgi:hypothetical protein